ncbi:hypothetical protein FF1_003077 [Malus domestica]
MVRETLALLVCDRDGWLKCKFDCASVEGSKRGGFGVVVRDKEGSFVAGIAGSSDWVTSSLLAELLAARKATSFSALRRQEEELSNEGPVLNDVRCLLQEFVHYDLSFVRRDANKAAHRLARVGFGYGDEIVWFEEPPSLIVDVLLEDRIR